jgi:hypothetical protein
MTETGHSEKRFCNFPIRDDKTCKRRVRIDDGPHCSLHKTKVLPEICTICISHILDESTKSTTACNHTFHADCLTAHVKGIPDPTCPNCRAPITNTYSLSTHHLGIPLMHVVQHTSNAILDSNATMKKVRDDITACLILEWIEGMHSIGQQLVAVHVGNLPFGEVVDVIRSEHPECNAWEKMNIILICPRFTCEEGESSMIWP